ncbi:MAG: DUF805 domain-containing protein [Rhodobacteraceae bacterium]|nr:DUF805 domain-containing protein [Paracoccaceae bacterium]MBR25896.1 DUF805 domain-containing protein [Paracoccaceae bacterium]
MGLADAVRVCLGKYVTFSGRASRSEFWYFVLAAILLSLAASALDMALFGETETATLSTDTGEAASASVSGPTPIGGLVGLALFLPLLAANWRRLHDTGRAGWWCLLPHAIGVIGLVLGMVLGGSAALLEGFDPGPAAEAVAAGGVGLLVLGILFAPAVAYIVLIVWLASRGEPGANRFGPPPHGA